MKLPITAAPGVAERAEVLAVAACDLHDVTSTAPRWSADAVEDAVEAMETTALALASAHPDAAAAMRAVGRQLAELRERLGLPPGEHAADPPGPGHGERPLASPAPPRRPERRGLGPGYRGIRIPPSRTVTPGAVGGPVT
ncbi:hypothetical protein GT034_12990 [Streptomyces sp. SID2563]|uniref:hypothetical protein n=1 Tax=Streptomyces sp. SID2563 TaxID=2690255 RepID=UPI00136E6684|nr:hypothetical protein [Streptomyces sp. SID2563]MYW09261.1 hypothetical protein [Streptomyces sp. SID2563]